MKRQMLYALLIGVLLLPLCGCRPGSWGIERKAHQYLSSRYRAEFEIIDVERIANETGPIPVLIPSYHWKLTAESSEFPGESFSLYYRENEENQWYWSDNYYSVLFREQAETTCQELAARFFPADCIVKSVWGISPWPEGINDSNTIQEWMAAGGKLVRFELWFCDFLPDEESCIAFADTLTAEFPNLYTLLFLGLTSDGYQAAAEQPEELLSLWNAHPDWQIGQIRFDCMEKSITQSAQYSPN